MKLQSTKEVTYNDSRSTSKTAIMTGEILETYKAKGITEFIYKYIDADGFLYSHDKYVMTEEEADLLFPLVEANLPNIEEVGYSAYNLAMNYEGMKIKMAERFSELELSDIEIIA